MFNIGTLIEKGFGITGLSIFFITLVWVIAWKGWALWIAARKEQKWWFIALLVVNTIGILDILYIFWLSKMDIKEKFNQVFKKEEKTSSEQL